MSDLTKYEFLNKMTLKATEVDLKRARRCSTTMDQQASEWVDELKMVLKLKVKLEQDTLQGPRLTFVGDYIKDKIKNKDWLP